MLVRKHPRSAAHRRAVILQQLDRASYRSQRRLELVADGSGKVAQSNRAFADALGHQLEVVAKSAGLDDQK